MKAKKSLIFSLCFCSAQPRKEWGHLARHPSTAWCSPHRVHRVATAAFWRTVSHEGKISPGWWGWELHAHSLSLHLPSPVKLQCTLQVGSHTNPVSSLGKYVLCGSPSPEPVAVYAQSPYYFPIHNAGIHNTHVVVCNLYCAETVIGRYLAVVTWEGLDKLIIIMIYTQHNHL